MSIIRSTTPPAKASLAVARALQVFLQPDLKPQDERYVGPQPSLPDAASLGLDLTSIDVATVEQHGPLGVYTLHLNDLSGGGIRAAVPTGWGFLVGDPKQGIILCTVAQQPVTGAWRLTSAYYGEHANNVFTAKDKLKSLAQTQTRSYELRILVIPAIHVEAFWLFDRSPSATDLVAVYVDGQRYVVPAGNPPSAATFLCSVEPRLQLAAASARRHGT
ncbi:MAG TPA: hypothetical protein VKB79_28750 [Bryobacteraceae bacterium]|nr:hypothetical protein [Bryobacteraceae bacterium]